jgi:hypothetical protein
MPSYVICHVHVMSCIRHLILSYFFFSFLILLVSSSFPFHNQSINQSTMACHPLLLSILSFAFPCHSIPFHSIPFHSILFIGAGGYTKVVLMYNNHMPHQHQYHHHQQQQQHNQCCTVLNWLYCYCDCDQLNTHIRIRSEAEAE